MIVLSMITYIIIIQLAWNKLEKNKFNLSMFERLIGNYYPHTLLLRQYRMHPDLVPLFGYHYTSKKYQGKKEIHSSEVYIIIIVF